MIKYDKDWKQIEKFASVKECINKCNLSERKLKKASDNKIEIDGFYYIIQPLKPRYISTECENCGKAFLCQRFRIEQHDHIFCSKKCEGEWRKSQTPLNTTCAFCGKQIHIKASQIAKCKKNYCSVECLNKDKKIRYLGSGNHQYGLKGNKNDSWKSDIRISFYGYKLIRCLGHPFRNSDDFVFEHRLIAEKYLLTKENSMEINGKKYLKKEYVVHHLDFNRQNNKKENLKIMLRNEHTSLHSKLNKKEDFEEYCKQYHLNVDEVYSNHLYNIEHYKYISA